jgi:hypothetical protein
MCTYRKLSDPVGISGTTKSTYTDKIPKPSGRLQLVDPFQDSESKILAVRRMARVVRVARTCKPYMIGCRGSIRRGKLRWHDNRVP